MDIWNMTNMFVTANIVIIFYMANGNARKLSCVLKLHLVHSWNFKMCMDIPKYYLPNFKRSPSFLRNSRLLVGFDDV